MLSDKEIKSIISFDKKLTELYSYLNFNNFPYNYEDEKKLFYLRDSYNPVYKYNLTTPELDIDKYIGEMKLILDSLHKHDSLINYLLYQIDKVEMRYRMCRAIGEAEFYDYAKSYYDWEIKLDHNYDNWVNDEKEYGKKLRPQEIKIIFEEALASRNIDGWEVIINNQKPYSVTVNNNKQNLNIGSKVNHSLQEVERLVVHEIDTHIARAQNAKNSTLSVFRTGNVPTYILAEEGLAVYNEYKTGMITPPAKKEYVLRYISAKENHKSFAEIYSILERYTDPDSAFLITFRAKRGLGDTSKSGGDPKISSYLVGFDRIRQLTDGDRDFLMKAKLGFNELKIRNYKQLF
jgi:hypothetical protein